MKVTIVPAQITTVEDRIAGSLGFSQLLLLAAAVFGGSALYIVLPPTMHSASYKLVTIAVLMFACSLLAIRIKGKILLLWLVVILRYNVRPRYYVFDKNSLASREQFGNAQNMPAEPATAEATEVSRPVASPLTTAQAARIQTIMANPAANLTFKTNRKGGLYALISKVKD